MEQSRQIVESIYDAFGRGDIDALKARLHPEVVVTMHGPATIPYGGVRKGPSQVAAWFGEIASTIAFDDMSPETIIASGDTVVVQGSESGRSIATGRGYKSGFVHVWKLRDGLVLRMDDYVDSAAVVGALAA
jgi:ketosteroid isomerase-like protein